MPSEFIRQSHSTHFIFGIYLTMLSMILSIFGFFALSLFVSEQGHTVRGLCACTLSTAGLALLLSVMAIVATQPIWAYRSALAGAVFQATFGATLFLWARNFRNFKLHQGGAIQHS